MAISLTLPGGITATTDTADEAIALCRGVAGTDAPVRLLGPKSDDIVVLPVKTADCTDSPERVTAPSAPAQPGQRDTDRVYDVLDRWMKTSEIEAATGLANHRVKAALNALREMGRVQLRGATSSARWFRTPIDVVWDGAKARREGVSPDGGTPDDSNGWTRRGSSLMTEAGGL